MTTDKMLAFIKKQRSAVIASIDELGFPNEKAMFPPRKTEGIRVFYFSTNTSSMRTRQYRENPKACLYFFRRGIFRCTGIMLRGTIEVLEDASTKEALWKTTDKIYYSKGVTDPDYCVLKFTASSGRCYQDLKTEDIKLERE